MNTKSCQLASSSIERGVNWLVPLVEPDGSIPGPASINQYYKTIYALATAGRPLEAERMLDYFVERFLKKDGDLDGTRCEWFDMFRIYAHAWLVMGATLRARFDVVHRILGFLDRYYDAQTGGFYTNDEQLQRQGEQNIMTTGVIALAYLWAGRLDVARQTGSWMKNLFDAQPDLSQGLYTVWDHQDGLVTEYPPENAVAYQVDPAKSDQRYYQYGVPAALLSSLYGATGERSWLTLAQEFLRASRHCHEDVYRKPQSGKIGWGAAWTYRFTRDTEDRRITEDVLEGLVALQHPEGWWSVNSAYLPSEDRTVEPDVSVTAELVSHLCWIRDCLDTPGG